MVTKQKTFGLEVVEADRFLVPEAMRSAEHHVCQSKLDIVEARC